MTRLISAGLMIIGIAAFTSSCCCPLDCLSLCLSSAPTPQAAGLTAVSAVDRAKLPEIPAGVPVTAAAAQQRF